MRAPKKAPKLVPSVATFISAHGDPVETWLSTAQVCAMFGQVSRMWIYRRQIDADFPQAVHLGGSKLAFFKLSEIQRWTRESEHVTPICNAPGSAS